MQVSFCGIQPLFFYPILKIAYNLIMERVFIMKEIFQEYGGILITVVAILSIILVVTAVIGSDSNSVIGKAFADLISGFLSQANASIK